MGFRYVLCTIPKLYIVSDNKKLQDFRKMFISYDCHMWKGYVLFDIWFDVLIEGVELHDQFALEIKVRSLMEPFNESRDLKFAC